MLVLGKHCKLGALVRVLTMWWSPSTRELEPRISSWFEDASGQFGAQARRAPSEGAEPESADEAGRAKSSCLRVLATAQGQWGVPIAAWQCNVSEM